MLLSSSPQTGSRYCSNVRCRETTAELPSGGCYSSDARIRMVYLPEIKACTQRRVKDSNYAKHWSVSERLPSSDSGKAGLSNFISEGVEVWWRWSSSLHSYKWFSQREIFKVTFIIGFPLCRFIFFFLPFCSYPWISK